MCVLGVDRESSANPMECSLQVWVFTNIINRGGGVNGWPQDMGTPLYMT